MECAVITTYRCNAKCNMCNIWEFPTSREEEFDPKILEKLPTGMIRLNITGGEPAVRENLMEIVTILNSKTKRLEISTNGYYTDRLIEIAKLFHNITMRISVEGLPQKNDNLRGMVNGFDHALRTMLRLKELGLRDIGFAMVISDKNVSDLLDVYLLSAGLGVEFSTSTLHNSYYFHKENNEIGNINLATEETIRYIQALLKSKRNNLKLRLKDWFRAYLNSGLIRHMKSLPRSLECRAATDSFIVDPWGRIVACNGSEEPWIMGDLKTQEFDEIWNSSLAETIRNRVKSCDRNCWMMGTAVPAMRKTPWVPAKWVIRNKARLAFRKPICLEG
jgi:Fe-coproporphyrin III synthase